jgi:hypothetical protein
MFSQHPEQELQLCPGQLFLPEPELDDLPLERKFNPEKTWATLLLPQVEHFTSFFLFMAVNTENLLPQEPQRKSYVGIFFTSHTNISYPCCICGKLHSLSRLILFFGNDPLNQNTGF